jgi:NitT/TauT family transport system substrate-binding protein
LAVLLAETFRALFYTPFYACFALGTYEAEGLDVKLVPGTKPENASATVLAGGADVMWGGPMRVMRYHDADPRSPIVGFAEVVTRDPFFLVGRTAKPDFRFTDLRDCRIATVSEVPTPWLCLQEDIRRAGVDPASLDRITDRAMAENAAALRAGTVDAIQVFEPFVETLVREGAGHIWYAAATRGPTSYTTLCATRETIAARPEVVLGMTRAVYRMQRWLHAKDPATIAATVADYFPDLDRDVLVAAIARYKALDLWGRTPLHPVDGFVRLKLGMLSAGFISRDIPYEECTDASIARRVIEEGLPAG